MENQILYLHTFLPLFKDLVVPVSLALLYAHLSRVEEEEKLPLP